jgi:hypothetical protein
MPWVPSQNTPYATVAQIQDAILQEFGLSTDSVSQALMPIWWGFSPDVDSYGQPNQYLQYLYTKRRVIMYQMAQARKLFDTTVGTDKFSTSQQVKNLLTLMKATTDEIAYADPGATIPWLESAEGINRSAGVGHIHDFFSREFYYFWEREWQMSYLECFGRWPGLPFSGGVGFGMGNYYGW